MLDSLTQANFKNFNDPWIEFECRTFNWLNLRAIPWLNSKLIYLETAEDFKGKLNSKTIKVSIKIPYLPVIFWTIICCIFYIGSCLVALKP